jgi:hypothetical protein
MAAFVTSAEINRYIDSELDAYGDLIYVVEYIGDDGETRHHTFYDHAEAYTFVRDEILEVSS